VSSTLYSWRVVARKLDNGALQAEETQNAAFWV
jgi:hypothetical protein